jgi:Domain of unknown function (DUF222)
MFEDVPEPDLGSLVAQIRSCAVAVAAAEAAQLRSVARFADVVRAEALAELASSPRVPGAPQDHDVVESAVVGELQGVLGVAAWPATRLVELAQRLTGVLPQVLAAVEQGRLDLARARVLSEATDVLSDGLARAVAAEVLAAAGAAPWEAVSPRAWRARIDRSVLRVDADAARRRRVAAHAARAVRSWATQDGMGVLQVIADAADLFMAAQVLTDLARSRPDTDAEGRHVSMDARRVDAFVDVFGRLRDGQVLPAVPVRRERELGLVMHADTFFGSGPAADDPGEVRGLGDTIVVDPVTAREQAHAMTDSTSSPTRVCVLLTDATGSLVRVVRLPKAPPGGWTRTLLDAAVGTRLGDLPALSCASYAPTVAITEQVRARNPRCAGYDCARRACACDLDHDDPWPRGPTAVENLAPRCRRHHEHKTRGLVRTILHPDGAVATTMLTRVVVTTRPEPLPGYAPGEGHATA